MDEKLFLELIQLSDSDEYDLTQNMITIAHTRGRKCKNDYEMAVIPFHELSMW